MRFLANVCVWVCFVAPIVSSAHIAKYSNFRNSTHTHDPALSHFPLHRYFRKSGTVPEFRINKPRLGNKLPVATLCQLPSLSVHWNIPLLCHGQSHPQTPDLFYNDNYGNTFHFFFYLRPQRPTFWQLSGCVNEASRHDAHNPCATMRVFVPLIYHRKLIGLCLNIFALKVSELLNNTP